MCIIWLTHASTCLFQLSPDIKKLVHEVISEVKMKDDIEVTHPVNATFFLHMYVHVSPIHVYMKVQCLAWTGPNQHLLASQTHNPFFFPK